MQRLVVLLLGRFARRLPRRQSTLTRAKTYQPPKPKSRRQEGAPRDQKPKALRRSRKLPATEAPTRVLASNAATYQRPEYSRHATIRQAQQHNSVLYALFSYNAGCERLKPHFSHRPENSITREYSRFARFAGQDAPVVSGAPLYPSLKISALKRACTHKSRFSLSAKVTFCNFWPVGLKFYSVA